MDHSMRWAQWSLQGMWQPFLLMSPKILRDISMTRTATIPVAATKGRCHLPVKFPVADTPTRKAEKNFWGGDIRHIQGFSAVRSDVRWTRWGSTTQHNLSSITIQRPEETHVSQMLLAEKCRLAYSTNTYGWHEQTTVNTERRTRRARGRGGRDREEEERALFIGCSR